MQNYIYNGILEPLVTPWEIPAIIPYTICDNVINCWGIPKLILAIYVPAILRNSKLSH